MSVFLSYYVSSFKYSRLLKKFPKTLKSVNTSNKTANFCRQFSQDVQMQANVPKETFMPFMELMTFRRTEAAKSILVQVQSPQSFKELHSYCNSLGTVNCMFHYTTGVEPLHFIIVEFAEENDVNNVLSESSHIDEGVPIHSQFLWFRASNRKLAKLKQSKNCKLAIEDGIKIIMENDLKDMLNNCENISDQMTTLHRATQLNDVGTRLRFLTTRQIESAVSGMFPYATAHLFGSTVNGCGKMGCDLDLVLKLDENHKKDDSRLIFHCKSAMGSERSNAQRHMEVLGDLIHLFLPGCAQVRRILQARVPIIKFHQQLRDVECDLSMSNMSGVHMSDFLYIMGSLDDRVRPLIFAVRKWASEVGITNSSPGRWITNFSLTLLVLAFLQNPLNSAPILPTLNMLAKLAGPKDKYVLEDGVDCSFLRNINKLKHKTINTSSLETLLCDFFEFYSQYDFSTKAVCLNESVALTKPDYSAMYIVNPLERGLNVSKNVSYEEVEKFQLELRNAAWTLESQEGKQLNNWGLLSIFESRRKLARDNLQLSSKNRRLMEVSALFTDEEVREGAKLNKIQFHNEDVKDQVEAIKKETQQKIKELDRRKDQR